MIQWQSAKNFKTFNITSYKSKRKEGKQENGHDKIGQPIFEQLEKKKILFLGGESAGLRCFKELLSHENINICKTVINPQNLSSRSFYRMLAKAKIQTQTIKELRAAHRNKSRNSIQYDLIISIHNPYLIDDEIIKASKHGGINLHPGKLPEYSGMNPISWSILNGESHHYVTLHKLSKIIDGGNIIKTKKFEISSNETAYTLGAKCAENGLNIFKDFLKKFLADDQSCLEGTGQDLKNRHYYGKSSPIEKPINFESDISKIERMYRCSFFGPKTRPWGYPRLTHNNKIKEFKAEIFKRHDHSHPPGSIMKRADNSYIFYCQNGWIQGIFLEAQ